MGIKKAKKTKVGFNTIPVTWHKKDWSDDDVRMFGRYTPGTKRKIEIWNGQKGKDLLDTIIHEGLHAFEEALGQDVPHPLINLIALHLTQYLAPFVIGDEDEDD